MTQHTTAEFAASRFATHPDGRIAARIYPAETSSWRTNSSPARYTDKGMAADGWSPLDETRPPRVVTDEMVLEYLKAHRDGYGGWPYHDLSDVPAHLVERTRRGLAAALSVAPTTDEGDTPANITRASEWLIENANTSDAEDCSACMAVADRECAVHHGVLALMADEEAHGIERDENGNLPAPTADEDAKIEGIRLALRRTQEYVEEVEARAEKAEQERAEARRIAASRITMTAREHLDAARASGYPLPKGATIPAGVPFWVKPGEEPWEFIPGGTAGDLDTSPFPAAQYVLVDPPTPKRPDGAEAIEDVLLADDVPGLAGAPAWLPDLADFLAERGVRAPEEES